MGQLINLISGIQNYLLPKSQKKMVFYLINMVFMILAVIGYYIQRLRVVGIIYVVILGFTMFAGINSLEDAEDGDTKRGF